jgi:hypothetical protein
VLTNRLSKVVNKISLAAQIEKITSANFPPAPTPKTEIKRIKKLLTLRKNSPNFLKDGTPRNFDKFIDPPSQPPQNPTSPPTKLKQNIVR